MLEQDQLVPRSPHMLPGGIGTYTISHIPYLYQNQQREENSFSNCSSYAASGFTLWDKSLEKKEHTRKEKVLDRTNIRAATMGQWQGMEQRSSSEQTSGLKIQSQSFMDMIRSAKGSSHEDDMDDDDDEEFVMKKENNTSISQRADLRVVKVSRKAQGNEQKPSTPRSKHSATEQRRRSKINDRWVIEYIHFLREKVNKHDLVPHQGNLMNLKQSIDTGAGPRRRSSRRHGSTVSE